jgi:protein TonB
MKQQTKTTCFSLLLHAALLLGAVVFSRQAGPIRPPVMLDFSILSASAGGFADSGKPGLPAARQPVKEKVISAVKKKAGPQTAKIIKTPPPEIAREPEAVSVTSSQQPAASADDATPSIGMATGPAAPAGAETAQDSVNESGKGGGAGSGVYTTGQLDGPLTASLKRLPVYPHAAKCQHIEGWIKVKFVVDERGHVGQIAVLEAEPQGVFEQSVLRCIAGWRFKPGTIGGMAVKALVQQTIFFKLD